MNGLTLLVLIALAIGVFVAYRVGALRGRRDATGHASVARSGESHASAFGCAGTATGRGCREVRLDACGGQRDESEDASRVSSEKARLMRSLAAEGRRAAARGHDRRSVAPPARRLRRRPAPPAARHARRRAPRPRATANSSSTSRTTRCRRCSTAPTRSTISSSSSASARCWNACCTGLASRPTGRSRAGASATSTRSTPSCPSSRAASAATAWVTQARELHQSKFGETAGALGRDDGQITGACRRASAGARRSCRSCCWRSCGAATGRC